MATLLKIFFETKSQDDDTFIIAVLLKDFVIVKGEKKHPAFVF